MISSSEPDPAAGKNSKTWSIGTLTYTGAALSALFFWLLWGDFAASMRDRSIGPMVQLTLKQFHASDMLVGLLVGSLPLGLGVLMGPVLSILSDRHRGPRGRRIPFLLYAAPLAALSIVGFAFSPTLGNGLNALLGAHSPGYHACSLIVFGLFLVAFDVTNGIAGMGFGGLINDVVPHEVIGRFFGLFRAVSLAAGIFFNYSLMGKVETHAFWMFIGVAIIYGGGMVLLCFKVREGEYPPPGPKPSGPWEGISSYFKECFAKPYYLLLFASMTISGLAFAPVNSFSIFYAKSIGVSMDTYGKYLAFTYACSFVITYLLGSLADRFHPLRVSMACMVLYAAVAFWGGFSAFDQKTFAVAFILHGVVSGSYATGAASLGQRLFPKTKYAQYASAGGIFGTAFWMAVPPLVGAILDWSGHVYRYTFLMGAVLAVISTVLLALVYSRFKALGGMSQYQAPE
jgi:maltose/moltooligosaccharide transporter